MITSRKSKKWIFPKGIVEPEFSPQVSAAEEAYEEAGVTGKIIDQVVGDYEVEKWGGTCTVTIYPLKVEKQYDDWPESFFRQRKWVTLHEAIALISKKEIIELLNKLPEILKQNDIFS